MFSYRLTLEYDGSAYKGWQQQPGQPTVEAVLRAAIAETTSSAAVGLNAAGRTDAGAHALGQVVSFALECRWSAAELVGAINARLPEDVVVVTGRRVRADFHARYSARYRHYRYLISERRQRLALGRQQVWCLGKGLDLRAMRQAASGLIGRRDMTSFCSSKAAGDNRVRTLRRLMVRRTRGLVQFDLEADGFLHGMARSLVGCLVAVGLHRQPPEWVGEVLALKDRSACAPVVPARGLTLIRVAY